MKIAYLVHWNEGTESGVFKKIMGHIQYWKSSGIDVRLYLYTRNPEWAFPADLQVSVYLYQGFADRFRQTSQLAKDILRWGPDLIYHRFDLFYPALAQLTQSLPIVLEINTDDLAEYRLESRFRYWYNRWTRGQLLNRVKGMVHVSRELSLLPHYSGYRKLSTVIANGIRLDQFNPLGVPANPQPNLVFLGSARQSWLGVDKILWLAEQMPQWTFDLIGVEPADLPGKVSNNVQLHGFLDRSRYDAIMARADIAIGTLALHRKNMQEASALKVREYLAYGIPTIIGYRETDFSKVPPFLLEIPNTENNVKESLGEIVDFVQKRKGCRVPREEIDHLDVKWKEKSRINFFRQVLEVAERG